jgi:ubiquinone/menaquinone biosynthesis C-methylase UbiE
MTNDSTHTLNEKAAAIAFNKQAPLFDSLYSSNSIIQYKRNRVRSHVEQYLAPHSFILELNAGTGEDAIYFATQGHKIHATDISSKMQEILMKKTLEHGLSDQISAESISFTSLTELECKGPFDLIFSNFAGLNCTNELDKVLGDFAPLLNPGGIVTLVILPSFCLWETLLIFRGKFKTAFRRFFSRNGRLAHIEGNYFKCWYYNPSYIVRRLSNTFEVLSVEGLCTVVPPSYIEEFPKKHSRLFKFLISKEEGLKNKWPWKSIGDYFIISLRKKA